jgi:hypothetical protein
LVVESEAVLGVVSEAVLEVESEAVLEVGMEVAMVVDTEAVGEAVLPLPNVSINHPVQR